MNIPTSQRIAAWDRLPDETDLAFERFLIYLELGAERSLMKVVERVGKSSAYKRQLEKWSSKHNWVHRAGEFDRHLALKSLKNKEDILDYAKGRLLKELDQVLDELFKIAKSDPVMYVGKGSTSILAQKLKAIEMVMDRAGLVIQKEEPESRQTESANDFIQKIHDRIENRNN